jgi:hypothetical protein
MDERAAFWMRRRRRSIDFPERAPLTPNINEGPGSQSLAKRSLCRIFLGLSFRTRRPSEAIVHFGKSARAIAIIGINFLDHIATHRVFESTVNFANSHMLESCPRYVRIPASTLSDMNAKAEIDEPFPLHRRPKCVLED